MALRTALVALCLVAASVALEVAVDDRLQAGYQVDTPHSKFKPIHEKSVKDGVAQILDEDLKPTAEELQLLVEGVQQPDLQALSITKVQIILQGIAERFTQIDHRSMMALRCATQHIHGVALPLKPLQPGEEKSVPAGYTVPADNGSDLELYSFITNRQLHNKILINMMGWFWIALAHPDNVQAAWKMGNILHNLGDTFAAGHAERSEPLRKNQVPPPADPLKGGALSQLLSTQSKKKDRKGSRFAEVLETPPSAPAAAPPTAPPSPSASASGSGSGSGSASASGSSLNDYVCGTEELNMFHSMDVADWTNHQHPDTVTNDFRFHCLQKHIAELVKLWKAGRKEVRKHKREDKRIAAINEYSKKAADYLCNKALRFNKTRLLWPAGGQPAGFSSRSELNTVWKTKHRKGGSKSDQPILPLGLTTAKASEEFMDQVARAIYTDDATNRKAKTMYIHGFTFPKRDDAWLCLDPEYKQLQITGPYLEVIMKQLSPKDHWVDFPGMGYRPEVTDMHKGNWNQLDVVGGKLSKWKAYIQKNLDEFLAGARAVFHLPWAKAPAGSQVAVTSSPDSSTSEPHKGRRKRNTKLML